MNFFKVFCLVGIITLAFEAGKKWEDDMKVNAVMYLVSAASGALLLL